MITVEVKDFQPWKRAKFEVRGITAIVGSTGSGKSSLLRALMVALFSRTGNDFIRNDQPRTFVRAVFSGRHGTLDVSFTKERSSSPVWVIDGETYTSAGRLGPREIFADKGIAEYEARGKRYNLFCQEQLEPLFVLKLPSTQAYDVFSQIFERNDISRAISQVTADARCLKQAVSWSEGGIRASTSTLDSTREQVMRLSRLPPQAVLSSIEDIANRAEVAQECLEGLKMAEQRASNTWAYISRLRAVQGSMEGFLETADTLAGRFEAAQKCLEKLTAAEYQRFIAAGQAEHAAELLDELGDFPEVAQVVERLQWARDTLECIRANELAADSNRELIAKHRAELAQIEAELAEYEVCPVCERPWE